MTVGGRTRVRVLALAIAALVMAVALSGCGSPPPQDKDSDGDGLPDLVETNGWTVTVDLVGHRVTRVTHGDPARADTDGDGLADGVEFQFGTDPAAADTDQDGLTDCQESFHSVRADCEDPAKVDWLATHHDGGTGTSARNADSDPGGSRYIQRVLGYRDDTGKLDLASVAWGDGIADGMEVQGYPVTVAGKVRQVRTDPMKGDTDGDGLDDGEEAFTYHSDPTVRDTDGDGCPDGRDIFPAEVAAYDAGVKAFRLKTDGEPGRAGRIQFTVNLLGNVSVWPAAGFTAAKGENVTVPVPPRAPGEPCTVAPYDAWSLVQVLAVDLSGPSPRPLDLTSQAPAGLLGGLWWNPRDQVVSAVRGGPAIPVPVHLSGLDAEAWLTPAALLAADAS